MADEGVIQESVTSIIGADERQAATKGHPIPPPPKLGIAAKGFLWLVAAFWLGESVDRFAMGKIGEGFGCVVGGVVAVWVRYGFLEAINRRRWENPQYRRMWLARGDEPARDVSPAD